MKVKKTALPFRIALFILLGLHSAAGLSQAATAFPDHDKQWQSYVETYLNQVANLDIPNLQLSYQSNLNAIPELTVVQAQRKVFNSLANGFSRLNRTKLTGKDKLDAALIRYELDMNITRLTLEEKWHNQRRQRVTKAGLYHQTMGQEWYAYYLQRWVDRDVTPQGIFEFGLTEIAKVKAKINGLREQLDFTEEQLAAYLEASDNHYHSAKEVHTAFEIAQREMISRLSPYFPAMDSIKPAQIERGSNKNLAQVPGYYNNNTLYFNFFDKQYAKGQIEWLYLHEAIPGHHYQINLARQSDSTRVQNLHSYYPGFGEGWAAYVEDIALELDAYSNALNQLGKWRWDLVRSVRVSLDVGLNYFGWSDEKAMEFWRSHITDRDDIGHREIARMKRWPAQVVTYKYGASTITSLNTESHNKPDTLLAFHRRILQHGSVPLSVLEALNKLG